MSRTSFVGVSDLDSMFGVLREEGEKEDTLPELDGYQFPLWDILKEIDRKDRRSRFDKKRGEQKTKTRRYMDEHPELVEEVKQKHGL